MIINYHKTHLIATNTTTILPEYKSQNINLSYDCTCIGCTPGVAIKTIVIIFGTSNFLNKSSGLPPKSLSIDYTYSCIYRFDNEAV